MMKAVETYKLLADAARLLVSSLDVEHTLGQVAHLLVPQVADGCMVDLLNDAGGLERVHVSHAEPEKNALARELFARYPPLREASRGPWSVVRSGQPEWVPVIGEAWLDATARDAGHRALLARLGLNSCIRVPLAGDGTVLGVLTLVFAESGRHYDGGDLEVVAQLGSLIASAVHNARTHARLRALTERKDEFLATLAHELRNPLAPIITAAELLDRAADDPPRVRTVAEVIRRQARHMSALVEDVLDVARVGRGDFAFAPKPLELTRPVAEAVEQVRPQLEARRHRLELAGLDAPRWVEGDATRLVQIVANVLSNAARYTPDKGHIRLSVGAAEHHAVIQVRDNGIGIAPEFLPQVFDLFSQQSRGLDREHAGLGIGLALVRRLVERHRGSVQAESDGPGRGACFTIRLPLLDAAAAAPPSEGVQPASLAG